MKLLFREKAFSWLGSYEITDEDRNMIFKVKGQPSIKRTLNIYDGQDNYLGKVTEKMISLTPHYKLYDGDNEIGEVIKEISLARPKFVLNCNKWKMTGDLIKMNYKLTDGKNKIMSAHKRAIKLIDDVYELDIENEENALYCVMIMLAMDAAMDKADKKE